WWRRPATHVAAAAGVVVALAILALPTTRSAVADFLGIDGIRISFDDPPDEPVSNELALGRRVDFDEAQSYVGFDLKVPQRLGDPDDIYINRYADNGEVTFVYRPQDDLPEAAETGVGALFTQFEGDNEVLTYKKKFVAGNASVVPVELGDTMGFWIDGAHNLYPPHAAPRVAGKTLLWQIGSVSYRLELNTSLEEALAIARSLE
ncbi:MAG: hypothetical protein ACRDKT_08375, partial [Actinomycetota bacterium]